MITASAAAGVMIVCGGLGMIVAGTCSTAVDAPRGTRGPFVAVTVMCMIVFVIGMFAGLGGIR